MGGAVSFCSAHENFILFKLKRASNSIDNSKQWNETNRIHVQNGIMRYDFNWILSIFKSWHKYICNRKKTDISLNLKFQIYEECHSSIFQQKWHWNRLDSIFKFWNLFVMKKTRFRKFSAEYLLFSKFPLKKISSAENRFICLRRRIDVYSPSIDWENECVWTFTKRMCWAPSLSLRLWKVFIFAGFSYGQESNTYTKMNTEHWIHSYFYFFFTCSQNKMLYCWIWYELHSIDTIIQYKCFCILLSKLIRLRSYQKQVAFTSFR